MANSNPRVYSGKEQIQISTNKHKDHVAVSNQIESGHGCVGLAILVIQTVPELNLL